MGAATPATSIAACRFCRRRCAFRCHDTFCRRGKECKASSENNPAVLAFNFMKAAAQLHLASKLRELGRKQSVNGSGLGIQADAELLQRLAIRCLSPAHTHKAPQVHAP